MARRTKEDAEATRNKLLDAAAEVFFAKGVAGASLSEVAQAAGLTRGAIYWHFKDKVDLFHTNYRDVYRWGVRQVTLEIIEWGCPEKSLTILKPRARAPHVRRMVEALKLQSRSAG